jgi:hypothetical protein
MRRSFLADARGGGGERRDGACEEGVVVDGEELDPRVDRFRSQFDIFKVCYLRRVSLPFGYLAAERGKRVLTWYDVRQSP